jgi:hypothetical protein
MQPCATDADVLERATDQLVDEICQRLTALYTLLDASVADDGPTPDDIRDRAAQVVRRLVGTDGPDTAALVAKILWPPQPGRHVPSQWWDTPLGGLISTNVEGPGMAPGGPGRFGHVQFDPAVGAAHPG